MRRAGGSVVLSALKIPGIRSVLGLYALDATLEFGLAVVLMVFVYGQTESPALVALMLTCKQIAPGALTAVTGLGLDRLRPRRALIVASSLRLVGLLMLGLAPFGVLTFVGAALLGFGGSIVRTVLRALLAVAAGAELRRASAALNVVFGIVLVYGPVLGAFLAATLPMAAAILLWLPMAALAGVLGYAMTGRSGQAALASYRAAGIADAHPTAGVSLADARTGWRLLIVAAATTFFIAMDEPALLAFVEQVLGGDVAEYGWLLAAWGGGLLVGGLVYGRLAALSNLGLFGGSALIVAAGYLGLAVSQSVTAAIAIAVVGGIGNGIFSASLLVAMFEAQPAAGTVRSSALLEFTNSAAPAAGMIAGGLIAELVAIRATLAIPGVATAALVIAWLAVESRATRRRHTPLRATGPAADAIEVAL